MRISPLNSDTIIALATPPGIGAIAVIRISGNSAIKITQKLFRKKNLKPYELVSKKSHTLHFGVLVNAQDHVIDEVLVSLFFGPHSYTGEDTIEISCHGSVYIQQQIIQLFVGYGVRTAQAGEFTLRAFLNGKLDLSQAEAVADLIASSSGTAHQVAMRQMRGGFSNKIQILREHLINFASLIELELDFSEEDVEFANREELKDLINRILAIIQKLISSFSLGNVIKEGIPVAIVGKPNAGKSTLLNALLNEDRAIVSEIPGTTRDTIEDEIVLGGVKFRFIDTAGIRETTDSIEYLGVKRTFEKMSDAQIVIYLFDTREMTRHELELIVAQIKPMIQAKTELLLVGNKIDDSPLEEITAEYASFENVLFISAKKQLFIDELQNKLIDIFDNKAVNVSETVITNSRHVEALEKTEQALHRAFNGIIAQIPGDLISQDIREALHYLGLITGEVTTDDLLGNIFSKFCIGK